MQHTIGIPATLTGTGLHSGAEVTMTLHPAPVGHGISFVRTDVTDRDNVVPARWDFVVDTRLCTVVGNAAGVTVGTVEHLMAALRGCGVDNAIVDLDGPEVPVMDGSSEPFVALIDSAGLIPQDMSRRAIRVLKEVRVDVDSKIARLRPAEGSHFSGSICFDHPSIGAQMRDVQLLNGNFRHDIASARTFGFLAEVETLRKNGLALGGSLENAIVLDGQGVINPEGLRHEDEFIRHKLLDAIGDLYLAGGVIIGAYESNRPGHALNNALLRALFADQTAWEFVDIYEKNSKIAGHPVGREAVFVNI
ncbi:MAG: UDP-3-O-acyl-N-acetylglucosamine deacetylase [Proteobacteria bacterium]|nr:UDP-3-O-acyl-N-acetylglucosamine deacetylase [Pseudomonadota bacterium]